MKVKLFWFVLLVLGIAISPIQAQPISCLDTFRPFTPIQPEIDPATRNESYGRVAAWYTDSRCIVVGSETGLWLYDIDQPDSSLQLAYIGESAINNVAVNPVDSTIAFTVAKEPTVHLIHLDGTSTSLAASGQAVTTITFSPDGSLIAVASVNVENEMGFYHDSRMQIWDALEQQQVEIPVSNIAIVTRMFFTSDNRHLLTDSVRQGYVGDEVDYWDVIKSSKLWSYNDLFPNIRYRSPNDPFVPFVAIMHNQTIALGGINQWLDYDDYVGTGIHFWDATTQERERQIVVFNRGIAVENELVDIAFNSDGSQIVSSQSDGTIKFWNVSSGEQIGEFDTHLESPEISFSPDDRFLAVTGEHEIQIWDIAQKRVFSVIQL